MRYKIAAVAIVLVAIAATVGASAYTTGSVSRSASINVVNDDTGLIGLSDGNSGDLVTTSSGQLDIDFTRGGTGGANADATFELGDPTDPTNRTAFNITNYDATSHDIQVQYTGAGATGDGTNNIEFQVYDSSGTKHTVSEESTTTTVTGVGSGKTLHVVVVVDTTNLDSTDDLSGTLTVSA